MQKGHSNFQSELLRSLARARSFSRALMAGRLTPRIGTRNGMRSAGGWVNWAVVSALPLLLAACAGVPRDASLPIDDPNEQSNRQVMALTQVTLRLAAQVMSAMPGPIHDRLRDFNSNLKEPRI